MVLGEKHGTNYLLYTNRRSYLSTYLEDGRCSFSNGVRLVK